MSGTAFGPFNSVVCLVVPVFLCFASVHTNLLRRFLFTAERNNVWVRQMERTSLPEMGMEFLKTMTPSDVSGETKNACVQTVLESINSVCKSEQNPAFTNHTR